MNEGTWDPDAEVTIADDEMRAIHKSILKMTTNDEDAPAYVVIPTAMCRYLERVFDGLIARQDYEKVLTDLLPPAPEDAGCKLKDAAMLYALYRGIMLAYHGEHFPLHKSMAPDYHYAVSNPRLTYWAYKWFDESNLMEL